MRRPAGATLSTLAVAGLALAAGAYPTAAATLPVPTNPDNPEVAAQWANPNVRVGEGERATLEAVELPDSIRAHDPFHVKLRVRNTSEATLEDLRIVPRRGPLTGSVEDQRMATIAALEEYVQVGEPHTLPAPLAPGDTTELELDIDSDALGMGDLGTYPLAFSLLDATGTPLDSERFHLSVRGLDDGARPGSLSALYPISAPVDLVPGETGDAPEDPQLVLQSESLAAQLAPGGRLDRLATTYLEALATPQVREATCAAIDPALVAAVDRMAGGYTVDTQRAPVVQEPKRLRDSWGSPGDDASGTPGVGAEDAANFLDALREISRIGCTVALPWANADLDAVARTGDPWLVRETIERGPFVLERVLGTAGVHNAVVPSTAVEHATFPALGWADHTQSTVPTGGMQAAWERANAETDASTAGESSTQSNLDVRTPGSARTAAAPRPETTVRVLVPANTLEADPDVSRETSPDAQRFAWAAPNVLAVSYQDALASVLASVGPQPTTASYAPELTRYDAVRDSTVSRATNAASAIRLAAQQAWTFEDQPASEPVFVAPPATWDADSAATLLGAVADLVTHGGAAPLPLERYLAQPADAAIPPAASVGTHYSDPGAYADTEILAATQQARFINDLTELLAPDPSIALTRYGYTLPLRRDLITALSPGQRRALHGYSAAVATTSETLRGSRDTLTELRNSVALIPPGNVYTRTSPSSPLLIVAQNGMPLPVRTSIQYRGPEDARLNVPAAMRIPARGSVTVQMTADLPEDNRETKLQLFLAGPHGAAMSQPVDITVRTAGMAVRGSVLLPALAALIAAFLFFAVWRKHRLGDDGRGDTTETGSDPPDTAAPKRPYPPHANGESFRDTAG